MPGQAADEPGGTGSAATNATRGGPAADVAWPAAYVHVVAVAVVGTVAVLAWLWVYVTINRLLWGNDFVAANRWTAPLIVLPFALATGLLAKYAHAPTSRDESLLDTLAGDAADIKARLLPANVLIAWTSLFSGAVLGPEGGIGGIGAKLAAVYADRFRIPMADRSRLVFATLAAAYNGLVASPLFTAVLATELEPNPARRGRDLPPNLIGGAVGFLVFHFLGLEGFRDFFHLSPAQPLRPVDLLLAVVFSLLGLAMALLLGVLMRAAEAVFGRFNGREVERTLLAGIVFSAVGVGAPVLLFSGESQSHEIVSNAASYGVVVLLAMAVAKLGLLAVALKGGFLGGPVFPTIFASLCVAEALGVLLPGVRIDLLVGSITAGFLTAVFRAPFMVILLVALMLEADAELTALIVLGVATALIAQPILMGAIAARRGATAPA